MTPRASQAVVVRYAATFVANVLRIGSGFISGVIIARALGADRYGQLTFILASFTAISTLLDSGSSSAFYTLLSARQGRRGLFAAYGAWLLIQFAILTLGILIVLPASTVHAIWFSTDRTTIGLGWMASFASSQLWTAVGQMGEALRRTVRVQIASTIRGIVHIAIVAAAFRFDLLTIPFVLALQAIEYALVAFAIVRPLYLENLREARQPQPGEAALFSTFVAYCRPLLVRGWVVFVGAFADRWLLERFGGSVQQGYFAVAQQFSVVSLLTTMALLQVLWKELAEAHHRGAFETVKTMYMRSTRMLFFVGALTSFLVIPHSRLAIHWTLGPQYAGALVPFALMLLYPIHQSLGQVQATLFQATGRTSTLMHLGLIAALINLPLTYFAFAPHSMFGLGGGAVPLALKMLIAQTIGIVLQARAIRKAVGWRQDPWLQAIVVALCAGLGFGAKWGIDVLATHVTVPAPDVVCLVVSVSLYLAAMSAILWRWPAMAGLDPDWMRSPMQALRAAMAGTSPLGERA